MTQLIQAQRSQISNTDISRDKSARIQDIISLTERQTLTIESTWENIGREAGELDIEVSIQRLSDGTPSALVMPARSVFINPGAVLVETTVFDIFLTSTFYDIDLVGDWVADIKVGLYGVDSFIEVHDHYVAGDIIKITPVMTPFGDVTGVNYVIT